MKRVTVYCGANQGATPAYAAAAQALGARLASEGVELVYGGGMVGLMGVLADAALAAGGHVIGVIPEALVIKEVVHEKLPDLRVVKSMHDRKALMMELGDAFIALPGGFGTYEELFEVLTWSQLGWHRKPIGLCDVNGFYQSMRSFLDHAVTQGFLRASHRDLLVVESDPARLLAQLRAPRPASEAKWGL